MAQNGTIRSQQSVCLRSTISIHVDAAPKEPTGGVFDRVLEVISDRIEQRSASFTGPDSVKLLKP